jgi:cyanophycinase
MSGLLALVGGSEWTEGCTFDRELLEASGGGEVLVLPTAAAYEYPDRSVEHASAWFAQLGGTARGLMVLARPHAEDPANADEVRKAKFIYLSGGSPLHLRSVLKDSAVWNALVEAWHEGAVVAGSSAGAMALCDPMVDPRGGAFTLGLGMIEQLAIVPHHNTWSSDKEHRTLLLSPKGLAIAGIDEATALLRDPSGSWRSEGVGSVRVFRDGKPADLGALPT